MLVIAAVIAVVAYLAPPAAAKPGPIATDKPSAPAVTAAPIVKETPAAPIVKETPAPEPPPPATVESLKVPGDTNASIVRAPGVAPRTVFVPGLCSNANAYLQSFPEAARKHGGVVAIEGDQPCVPGFRSFSWDAAKLDARIEAALAAAEVEPSGREGVTLVGYSQGAALAEQLVQRWPERYARFVIIGAPTDPSAAHFKSAHGVVTMSCSRDVPARMKEAARKMNAAKIPAIYMEMPGCTHGNITDGDRVFDEAFDWLAKNGA